MESERTGADVLVDEREPGFPEEGEPGRPTPPEAEDGAEESWEDRQKRVELYERLGLVGQIDHVKRSAVGLNAPLGVFELRVLETMLSRRIPVQEFEAGSIDLQAAELIERLQQDGYTVEVWMDNDNETVHFIAWTGRPSTPFQKRPSEERDVRYFLLPIGEPPDYKHLTAMAVSVLQMQLRPKLLAAIKELEAYHDGLRDHIFGYLVGRKPNLDKAVGVYL